MVRSIQTSERKMLDVPEQRLDLPTAPTSPTPTTAMVGRGLEWSVTPGVSQRLKNAHDQAKSV